MFQGIETPIIRKVLARTLELLEQQSSDKRLTNANLEYSSQSHDSTIRICNTFGIVICKALLKCKDSFLLRIRSLLSKVDLYFVQLMVIPLFSVDYFYSFAISFNSYYKVLIPRYAKTHN